MKRKRPVSIIQEIKELLGDKVLYYIFLHEEESDVFSVIANTNVSDACHSSFVSVDISNGVVVRYDGRTNSVETYPIRSSQYICQLILLNFV